MEIGEVIKMFIKNRKMSQADVAKAIGKSTTALSQIINGVYKPQS
ncbi:helix-turn-helix transcriptional regulator, partial [Flavobacterium sp.]